MFKMLDVLKISAFLLICSAYTACSVKDGEFSLTTSCPQQFCQCSEKKQTATCSGHGKKLSYIPELPLFIKRINLDSDYFFNLTKALFQPVVRNDIREVTFKSSQVHHIASDAFQDLANLSQIDLSTNVKLKVNSLKLSLASLKSDQLNVLVFKYMRWTTREFNTSLFVNIKGRRMQRLNLGESQIDLITDNAVIGLEGLEQLVISGNLLKTCDVALHKLASLSDINLSNNKIIECKIEHLPPSLEKLSINNNYIPIIPSFCSSNGTALLPKLSYLRLDSNNIDSLSRTSFQCLESLKHLHMKQNNIKILKAEVFANLINLHSLNLNQMKQSVQYIYQNAFNIPSLKKLSFVGNKFRFDIPDYAKRASLGNCTNLKYLDVSSNYMPRWNFSIIYLLRGLDNLTMLRAIDVKWNLLPNKLFLILPKLEEVDLSNNRITSLNRSLFPEHPTITNINLGGNRIAHIGPETFPAVFWRKVQTIDLSGNPFSCDCNLLWFRDKLKNSSNQFSRYPKEYKCLSPPYNKGLRLERFNLTQEECKKETNLYIALIAAGSFAIFTFLTILVVYNGRWHIRYWLYLLRYKKTKYNRLINEDFKYHGFIIYSDDDSEFVHDVLLNRLENEEGCRMCVHFRDFEVGKIIVDNIVECMSESRLALVILSKHFCKSKWCKFELLVAQDRWFSNKSEALLPVMLEEIDSSDTSNEIRTLLQTTTYCKWSEDEVGQRLFWEQIIHTLKANN